MTERVLTQGILSAQTTFRVLVEGPVGKKELGVLIKKLSLDKDLYAEADAPAATTGPAQTENWSKKSLGAG